MNQSVFISREPEQVVDLLRFCKEKQWEFIAQSFIHFTESTFETPSGWKVIFFPSPRAVSFFFKKINPEKLADKQIACAGEGTAKEFKNHSAQRIDFIAEQAGNTENVRVDFQKWLGNRTVLYVGSNLAQKNVLLNLPHNQWQFIQVYETNYESNQIPTCSIYIFSSPSNVDSFFRENKIPADSRVIAWGNTTAQALEERKINVAYTLQTSKEKEIIEYLKSFN
jgi:uroporphyrinogen-III synthase